MEKFGDAPVMHASNPKVRVSEDRATSKVFFLFAALDANDEDPPRKMNLSLIIRRLLVPTS